MRMMQAAFREPVLDRFDAPLRDETPASIRVQSWLQRGTRRGQEGERMALQAGW